MDFSFTDEQQMMIRFAVDYVQKELSPEKVRQMDEAEEYPLLQLRQLGELGWLGLPFPERYGGSGGDILDLCLFLEQIGRGMVALGAAYLQTVVFGGMSLLEYGSGEQKEQFLPALIAGKELWCLAATEPNAGSDLASLAAFAAPTDTGDLVVNGAKCFITGAHMADYMLMAVRTSRQGPNHRGITMVILDSKTPGVEVRRLHKLGMRPVGTNEVFLDNVIIPADRVAGGLNQGWFHLLRTLDNERCTVAAICVGAAQAVVDDALRYVQERQQFGQPVSKFQVIQHNLAEMQLMVDSARYLMYRAAWLNREGKPCGQETAMAKLHAAEVYGQVADRGLRLLGGYGYMMEYPMQRHFRDAKFFQIAGGTAEIQRQVIARGLGL